MITQAGIYSELTNEDYHADEALGSTMLKSIKKRPPFHFYKNHIQTPPVKTEKSVFSFGRAAHSYILTPSLFPNEFAVIPEGLKRGKLYLKNGKPSKWGEWALAQKPDCEFISASDFEKIKRMGEAFDYPEHSRARDLLTIEGNRFEESIFWQLESGTMCKARFDLRSPFVKVIADYKTCDSAEFDQFSRGVFNYGYDISARWYLDGAFQIFGEKYRFVWIAQEKDYPHCVALYEPDEQSLIDAGAVVRENLATFESCKVLNDWPSYPNEILSITPPAWKRKKIWN